MGTQARARGANGSRRHRGRRAAVLLLTALVVQVGRAASAAIPATPPGAPRCEQRPARDTVEYLVGIACPPADFARVMGYAPQLVQTSYGWRYVKPTWAGGECSGPLDDAGPFWDFTTACGTHDYGFDLMRMGLGDRSEVDRLLYGDMKQDCRSHGLVGNGACKNLADSAYAVLRIGEWAGLNPGAVPQA